MWINDRDNWRPKDDRDGKGVTAWQWHVWVIEIGLHDSDYLLGSIVLTAMMTMTKWW